MHLVASPGLRLAPLLWSVCVLGSIGALVAGFAAGVGLVVLTILPVLLLVGLARLERQIPIDRDRHLGNDPQRWHDVGHLLAGALAGEVVGNLVIVTAAVALAATLPPVVELWPHAWPVGAQVILLILAADFLEYWRHRAEHRVPWLWRIHALHHDADRLHVLKSSRNHALDLVTRFLVVFAPLALVGVPPLWLPVYTGAILVFGPLSHANLDLSAPHWLDRIVVTPGVHRLHHALDRRYSDSNFAAVTPLWDVVFGTFQDPAQAPPPTEFGIDGEAWPKTFLAQLAAPFRSGPS